MIGEFPEITFNSLHLEINDDQTDSNFNVKHRKVEKTWNDHKLDFYVLEREYYLNYSYLCNIIQKHFLNEDKVLIHCQQGLNRSATLLTFYLRSFYFNSVNEANYFIGIKWELACDSTFMFSSLEKIFSKSKLFGK